MKNKVLLFLVFAMLSFAKHSFSQYTTASNAPKKVLELYNQGIQMFQAKKNKEAKELFLKAVTMDPTFIDGWENLGELSYFTEDFNGGVEYFEKVTDLDDAYKPKTYYWMAKCYEALDDYANEYTAAQKFLSFPNGYDGWRKECELMKKDADFRKDAMAHPVNFKPIALEDSINSDADEYAPAISAEEDYIIFTRKDSLGHELFYQSIKQNDHWRKAWMMSNGFNSSAQNGQMSISADGYWCAFASDRISNGYSSMDIFMAHRDNAHWTKPVNVGVPISTSITFDSQPTLSADGNTMYFVSSGRPDSYGAEDIYVSYRNLDGVWSKPLTLGPKINTGGHESSPFIHPDGKTLYFSSDGLPGMGGEDIFVTHLDSSGYWSDPVNLGYPINSKNDEVNFIVSLNGKHGYYSSGNYIGSQNLNLMMFDMNDEVKPAPVIYVKGVISDAKTFVKLGANVQLLSLATGKVVMNSFSDNTLGNYLCALPGGQDYALNVSKDGYLFHSETFSLKDKLPDSAFVINVAMEPIVVGATTVLKNIFFETNSFALEDKSKVELNKLIEFMTKNPTLKIEIGGHTDDVGTDFDNQKLSENRAKSVNDYLVANGITAARLSYKGYGETKPIAPNNTSDGRALNRRTEFKVVAK